MEFLSSSHWSQIADAAALPREDAEAELAWFSAQDRLLEAMESLALSRRADEPLVEGQALLESSLLKDPGMADSWLALFLLESLRPVSSLERYRAILEALAVCAERLGEQQRRFDRWLSAYYVPSLATRVPLSSPTDARLLYVGHLTGSAEHGVAELWLDRCDDELAQSLAARAYLRLHQGEFADSSDLFEGLADDDRFAAESRLGAGMSLAGMGLWEDAAVELEESLLLADGRSFRLKARYLLATVLSHVDPDAERRELERLWAEAPGFADVAERLGRGREPSLEELWRLLDAGEPE